MFVVDCVSFVYWLLFFAPLMKPLSDQQLLLKTLSKTHILRIRKHKVVLKIIMISMEKVQVSSPYVIDVVARSALYGDSNRKVSQSMRFYL